VLAAEAELLGDASDTERSQGKSAGLLCCSSQRRPGAIFHKRGFDVVGHRLRTQQERAVNLMEIGRQSRKAGSVSREVGWTSQNKRTGNRKIGAMFVIVKHARNPESVRGKDKRRQIQTILMKADSRPNP